jgi:signal transduction histidine kinase/CheY-like chemotaxis protein
MGQTSEGSLTPSSSDVARTSAGVAAPAKFTRPEDSAVRRAAIVLAMAVLYFLAARLGLSMAEMAEQVTVVWPPTGLALAAVLLLGGRRVAPGVWLGALAANLAAHATLPAAVGIASGNTLEALLGAWLLRRAQFHASLGRIRDVLALVGLAALVSPAASATIGLASLSLAGVQPWTSFGPLWGRWWLGDASADLLLAPFILTWGRPSPPRWSGGRAIEAAAILVSAAAVSLVAFGNLPALPAMPHFAYAVFPFGIWAALRLGPRGPAAVNLLTAAVAIWGTSLGYGPFGAADGEHRLIWLQTFMTVFATTTLILGAAIGERRTAERRRAADYAVTRALAETRSLEAAAPGILRAICESLDWDVGALWRVDAAAGHLSCVEVWSRPGLSVAAFVADTRLRTFGRGVGLPGRVWASGQPAWVEDVVHDANFPRAPLAAAERLHGAFGFPIRLRDEVVGVIEFFSREIRAPDEDLLRMFTTVGAEIGQQIEQQRADGELRRASQAKDEFLAVLGHELRNPLSALRTGLEVLRLQAAQPEGGGTPARVLAAMDRQLHHLTRLVDDLLDVSRITRGHIELLRSPVDLSAVVARTVESAGRPSGSEAPVVTVTLPAEPVLVDGDAVRLEQVVTNLLSNALRYTQEGGHVAVAVTREGDRAVLRVRDDGIGIPPDMRGRIFDLFTQASRRPDRPPEGLGVGLTLVRRVVELHGGAVRAASDGRGRGSEFTVELPLLAAGASSPAVAAISAPAATPPEAEKPRMRILVVDDNLDAAETVAMLLRAEGQEIEVAHDGPEALRLAGQRAFDLVLLDIGLPGGMDGYEVARRMRAELAPPPVLVALTGYGQAEDRLRAQEAGFQRHLVKPVEPSRLRRTIDEVASLRGGPIPSPPPAR